MVKNNKYVLLIGMILAVFAVVCLSKAADTQQMSEETDVSFSSEQELEDIQETPEAEMPVTMIRLNLVKGLGPVLQIAEGWTVRLPDEVTEKLMRRTDYTWPCTWFTPRCDGVEGSPFCTAYDVMNNWGANHGAISYGHVGADLITLCSMLRIPVCMHNVPGKDVFRPAAWNAFGMDKEGQDYRACAAYGPMYRNIR